MKRLTEEQQIRLLVERDVSLQRVLGQIANAVESIWNGQSNRTQLIASAIFTGVKQAQESGSLDDPLLAVKGVGQALVNGKFVQLW